MKNKTIKNTTFITIILLYLELIYKFIINGTIISKGLIYTLIFTIPIIVFIKIITGLFKTKTNKIIMLITIILLTVYFEMQYIFYELFSVPFSFSTMGIANQAFDFTSVIKDAILAHLPIFISILMPLIIFIIINKKIETNTNNKYIIISLIIMLLITYSTSFIYLIPNKKESNSPYKLYYNIDNPISIIEKFGLITYTKIDIKRQIIGYKNELVEEIIENKNEDTEPEEQEIVYKDNIMNLNFYDEIANSNLQTLNSYFENATPTKQNEYTGKFKGKNLIFILAEGFNEIAVDEVRTPTLYKMINNGFVFNDFYSPVYLSTTGGEFQATTGLLPTQEILSAWKTQKPSIDFALGNSFTKAGYDAQSYHDWTYAYYKRQVTMPTLGFNNYIGCGNGLEKRMNCDWLPFDSEMINVTIDDYVNKEVPFVTYYVTVSGHSPYNAGDNIGRKYIDNLKDTNYSTAVKYYLAAQMELDKMLEMLVQKLDENGKLNDTVIALVGDHYPYTLSIDEMNQVSNYQKDGTIEVNHSNFIIWNNEMKEPIQVNKVGSQIDVLPTLLNLFDIEYDSRLIVGKDILSDYECLAIFSNYSWVSDYGTYNANTRRFTPKEGKELENIDEYVSRINNRVSNSFSISKLLVKNNYYNYILNR